MKTNPFKYVVASAFVLIAFGAASSASAWNLPAQTLNTLSDSLIVAAGKNTLQVYKGDLSSPSGSSRGFAGSSSNIELFKDTKKKIKRQRGVKGGGKKRRRPYKPFRRGPDGESPGTDFGGTHGFAGSSEKPLSKLSTDLTKGGSSKTGSQWLEEHSADINKQTDLAVQSSKEPSGVRGFASGQGISANDKKKMANKANIGQAPRPEEVQNVRNLPDMPRGKNPRNIPNSVLD